MKHCLGRLIAFLVLLALWNAAPSAAQAPDGTPVCPAEAVICRVDRTWTLQELRAEVGELGAGQGGFFARGDQLTFVYRALDTRTQTVSAIVSDEAAMQRVEDSDWWVITLQFDGVDDAILSFGIADRGTLGRFAYPFMTWRGRNASPSPPVNDPLVGTYQAISFKSAALDEIRHIYLYLPPDHDLRRTYPVIYMTDGDMLSDYAAAIDYQITAGHVPPLIVVGVESGSNYPQNVRGEEYVPGRNPTRFEQHERFFTQEVREWAEITYGASTQREERLLFGVSNGGLFAIVMTLHHPDLYGVVFPFSAGASQGFEGIEIKTDDLQLPLRVYSAAGTLDPIFYQSTYAFAQAYEEAGAEVVFSPQVSGHTDAMWQVEFIKAIQWVYDEGRTAN
jgi:enterochelin esterase-like enzyme